MDNQEYQKGAKLISVKPDNTFSVGEIPYCDIKDMWLMLERNWIYGAEAKRIIAVYSNINHLKVYSFDGTEMEEKILPLSDMENHEKIISEFK